MEFSAEREVRTLGYARRLIEARAVRDDGEAFAEVEGDVYGAIALREDFAEELRGVVVALSRFGSVLALSASVNGETRDEAIDRVYESLAQASLDEDPAATL